MSENQLTKTSFFEDKFSVDNYLSNETQKTTLTGLLEELKTYRNDLQNHMGEILRTETESIVHLAESLTQLTTKIQNLFIPISQFKEEIKLLSDGVISTRISFEETFHEMLHNYDKMQYMTYQEYMLKEIINVDTLINCIEPNDPSYEQILSKGCSQNEFLRSYIKEKKLDDVHSNILQQIKETDNFHLNLITNLFFCALNKKQMVNMVSILKMYKSIHAFTTVEMVYRKKFIQPALDKIFYTDVKTNDEDQLTHIFQESTRILNDDVGKLHDLIQLNPALEGFNFIINSYWLEVDKHLQETLHHYTAPGNPELFQKRYKAIWKYFQDIMSTCRRFNISYDVIPFENHVKSFNLAVYYEIRYQQISTRFESVLMKTVKNAELCEMNSSESAFKLNISNEYWTCSELCFRSDIFVDQLIEHFFKLSMLLLSRLLYYFLDTSKTSEQEKNFVIWQKFYVYSIHDLNLLLNHLSIDTLNSFDNSIFAIIPLVMRLAVMKGIQANKDAILNICDKLRSSLMELISKISYAHLQNVRSIPRLYRKTNKDVPMQPSNYVILGVKPIISFHLDYSNILKDDLNLIMDLLVKQIGNQFFDAVTDVLQSVSKIEESLRRLKQRNMTPNVDDENVHSDKSKIKQQIKLDVGYLVDNLNQFSKSQSDNIIQKLRGLI